MIRFLHVRPQQDGKPTTRGGVTVAYVFNPEMDQVDHWAYARCSSKDNFCRKTGRIIAEGRLHSPRQSRKILPCSEKAFIASVTAFVAL